MHRIMPALWWVVLALGIRAVVGVSSRPRNATNLAARSPGKNKPPAVPVNDDWEFPIYAKTTVPYGEIDVDKPSTAIDRIICNLELKAPNPQACNDLAEFMSVHYEKSTDTGLKGKKGANKERSRFLWNGLDVQPPNYVPVPMHWVIVHNKQTCLISIWPTHGKKRFAERLDPRTITAATKELLEGCVKPPTGAQMLRTNDPEGSWISVEGLVENYLLEPDINDIQSYPGDGIYLVPPPGVPGGKQKLAEL